MTARTPGPEGSGVVANAAEDEAAAAKLDAEAALRELWQEFKATAEGELRERLILHYSPLVKYVAGRVGVGLPPNIEQADLVSYGIFGLIDAIEKFDLGRAIKFETYQGRDHRRASSDRLDPAFGPVQGPRGRKGVCRARVEAAPHADGGGGRARTRHWTRRAAHRLQPGLLRQRHCPRRVAERRRRAR
jgi:hypothetical protein